MRVKPITSKSGGPRVEKLRRAVNGKLGARRFSWRKIPARGSTDKRFFEAVHMAAWLVGFSEAQLKTIRRERKVTRHVELILLGKKQRTPAMKKRDWERRDEAAKLRREHRQKGTLRAVKIRSVQFGRPHWGGSADIMGQLVAPYLLVEHGLVPGSGKRTPKRNAEVGGSSRSDHLTTRLAAFARDFPTFDGERPARGLARKFGWMDWEPNSYAYHFFRVGNYEFRIQILWGDAIFHGDHIHVGIEFVRRIR